MVKNLPSKEEGTRDVGSIPRMGRSPGGGNGSTLYILAWENPLDCGTWWVAVHGVAKESDVS